MINLPIRASVALSFVCIVLDVVQRQCDHNDAPGCLSVDPEHFYRGSLTYTVCDRVGGVLSFLNKTFYSELERHIGNREIFANAVGASADGDALNNVLSMASYRTCRKIEREIEKAMKHDATQLIFSHQPFRPCTILSTTATRMSSMAAHSTMC